MTKIKRLNVSLIITVFVSLIILYKQRKRIKKCLDSSKKERRGIEILARLLFNINNMTNEKKTFFLIHTIFILF